MKNLIFALSLSILGQVLSGCQSKLDYDNILKTANNNTIKIEEILVECLLECGKDFQSPKLTTHRPYSTIHYQKKVGELVGADISYLTFYYDGSKWSGLIAYFRNSEFIFLGESPPSSIEIGAITFMKIRTSGKFSVYKSSISIPD